ncbi:TPA: restriction endonuclease subunit S [Escherichia coli]|uniref:restriction endonuclease subunit S n=1 Tax=Escherichia coli TaxID=562 RepID=UPI0008FFDC50|nr:restriction endonuclease subunit S [Escherichia coli]EEW8280549.1 type II restriction endonuclease subunit R [Escherichia coli]EFA1765361.1 type II restriction endonuclease subunit R [Escherichia coli]MBF5215552.1 type II restriction endonuclease subunit R [Escherichia coli]MBF5270966.1 type II restriction endonuclease subunit R [Escherichia coli]MBF5285160.1 type II restriction endonuclease subunit R [Escherichia coli]
MKSGGKWEEYTIERLFSIQTPKKKFNANKLTFNGNYPYVARGSNNNGIKGYIDEDELYLNPGNTISFGQDTATMFYQENAYFTGDKIKIFSLRHGELNSRIAFFLISAMKKSFSTFSWGSSSFNENVLNKVKINIPTFNNVPAYNYMVKYIEELEAYLIAAGLSDYQLTEKDYLILEHFKNIEFSGFPVTELFSVCNTGNILSRDIIENSGDVPYLCASRENNSVSSYIAYDNSLLEKGNCIFIGGKTFVVTYQERDFFSNDSHNLRLYVNNEDGRTKFAYLGIISCIYRSISHKYSWGDSVSNRKIKNDVVWLPVKNKSPDFCYINDLISVVHKLVIKDVVQYAERKMNAYRQAITSRGYDDSGVS